LDCHLSSLLGNQFFLALGLDPIQSRQDLIRQLLGSVGLDQPPDLLLHPPGGRLQTSAPDMAIEPEAMIEKATIAFGPLPNESGNGICGLS